MRRRLKTRFKNAVKNRRGDALIVVLCIMVVLIALSSVMLVTVSSATGTMTRSSTGDRTRIMASTFAGQLGEEMTADTSQLKTYIHDSLLSGGWEMLNKSGEKNDTTLKKLNYEKNSDEMAGYDIRVEAWWEGDAGRTYQNEADFLNARLFIRVIAERGDQSASILTEYIAEDAQMRWRKEGVK